MFRRMSGLMSDFARETVGLSFPLVFFLPSCAPLLPPDTDLARVDYGGCCSRAPERIQNGIVVVVGEAPTPHPPDGKVRWKGSRGWARSRNGDNVGSVTPLSLSLST